MLLLYTSGLFCLCSENTQTSKTHLELEYELNIYILKCQLRGRTKTKTSRHNNKLFICTCTPIIKEIFLIYFRISMALILMHSESVLLRISCYSFCLLLDNNLLPDLPKVWFLVDSFLVLAHFVQFVVRFDYWSQGVSIPLRPWSILARRWLPLEMGARFLPTDPKKEHIYKRSLKKLMQNQLLENVNLLDTAHL